MAAGRERHDGRSGVTDRVMKIVKPTSSQQPSRPGRAAPRLASLLRHEGGVSATEFALIAPMLIAGLLPMADIGLAAYQRMSMDHVLRAGAQRAMDDPGVEKVRYVLESTAVENFNLRSSTADGGKPLLTLTIDRYCVCPADLGTRLACSTICTGSVPTLAYYSLSASLVYSGMVIPRVTFEPRIQVQVR